MADDASLPALIPVLVAVESDVDELVRRGRADVAMLTLKLRSTMHDAAHAPQAAEPVADTEAPHQLEAAHALLDSSLARQLDRRRSEFAEAVERARVEAAVIVTAAHKEATALLSAANAEIVETLLNGLTTVAGEAPTLRVVADSDEREPSQAVEPVGRAVVAPAAFLAEAPTFPVAMARPGLLPALPVAPVPSPAQGTDVIRKDGRWSIKQFLYLDVVLPMIAVIIVIVILLAWVG